MLALGAAELDGDALPLLLLFVQDEASKAKATKILNVHDQLFTCIPPLLTENFYLLLNIHGLLFTCADLLEIVFSVLQIYHIRIFVMHIV
jgi:hypothetical protein